MRSEQRRWDAGTGWRFDAHRPGADLVWVFGDGSRLGDADALAELRRVHPRAVLFGCSTAGEIFGTSIGEHSLVATAIEFDRTRARATSVSVERHEQSRDAGIALADALREDDLAHVFVLSDGLTVNGSQLVEGLTSRLPAGVAVTGGLAADGTRFSATWVLVDDAPQQHVVSAVGLYGDSIRIGSASLGGWDPFGPERLITRARDNVLYELDGQSALALYKRYLGEHARDLPSSGLLFPLSLRIGDQTDPVVRTILSINEDDQSMTFAGDVPEGALARLMKANFDRLIDGAIGAAGACRSVTDSPEFALLISCVGRRLILKQRTEEEVEAVRHVLGPQAQLAGFYSYGEISPFTPNARCQLHNQTMTITTMREA